VQLELDGASMVIVEAPKPTDRAHAARTASWFTSVTSTPCSSGRKHAAPASRTRPPTSRSASANARSKIGGHRWTFSQTIADVDPIEWGGELVSRS